MVMAARAAHGESEPCSCRCTRAIDDILHVILLRNRPAFEVDHVVAVESARDFLFERRVGKQVASQLLDRELVERHVAVEGANHPIAPRPDLAQAVDVKAMGIGVTRQIEPLHRHSLAVVQRLQQLVHSLFVCVCRRVSYKRIHFGGNWRQTG